MFRRIEQATGLDGYAHSSPAAVSADSNQWLKEKDRFVIVTANVGEMLSGLRVADENGARSIKQGPRGCFWPTPALRRCSTNGCYR